MNTRINNFLVCALLIFAFGCHLDERTTLKPFVYTGNEVTYALASGSEYNISGTATLKERIDYSTDIIIALSGTSGNSLKFPVHLHFGDISIEKAKIALQLRPVDGQTGNSETTVTELADESAVTFAQLKTLNASIKIHLSNSGDGRNIILAAGNIGSAMTASIISGRSTIGLCTSR
jgi:hypothetical protein